MSFFEDLPFAKSIFGSKPQVAKFTPLNLGTEQGKAIGSNITNFDQIAKLGDLYRQNMIEQQNAILPGYSENLAKGEADTGKLLDVASNFLSGDLPPDVISQIERSDAYQAMSGGYAGSQMSHNLTARDLGLTSLDLMRQGASMLGQGGNSAQQWAGLARGDIMNPAGEFISPSETANFDLTNTVLKQQSDQFGFNVAAAPDPAAAAFHNTIMGLLGMYLGGGKGSGSLGQAGQTSFNVSSGI